MQNTASRQRGLSDFHIHYNAIRHQLLVIFIAVSLLTISLIYTLDLLTGDYGR
jgi:hypothetical protein